MNNNIRTPQLLWFLLLSYTMTIMLANWFDARLVQVLTFNTDGGTIIFPLTFLLSDIITEVYGYQQARRAIWCGFLFNAVFALYGQEVIHLPSPLYALASNAKFDDIMGMNIRVIIASTVSYFCSEPLNSLIIAKLKIYNAGKKLALRFVLSTIIASFVDSIIFGTIAFSGWVNQQALIELIITMWVFKVSIEIIGLPLSLFLTKKLKKLESLDIYDKKTNFNLFRFKIDYTEKDNQYASL